MCVIYIVVYMLLYICGYICIYTSINQHIYITPYTQHPYIYQHIYMSTCISIYLLLYHNIHTLWVFSVLRWDMGWIGILKHQLELISDDSKSFKMDHPSLLKCLLYRNKQDLRLELMNTDFPSHSHTQTHTHTHTHKPP